MTERIVKLPHADVSPAVPDPGALWGPVRAWIWAAYAYLILAAIPDYLVQFWFNTSLGFRSIFFTNFVTQCLLFIGYGAVVMLVIQIPIRRYAASEGLRKASIHFSLWIAIFAGWRAAHEYLTVLLALHGVPFGRTDPVFGHDIGFYVYWLPLLRRLLEGAAWALGLGIVATIVARFDA